MRIKRKMISLMVFVFYFPVVFGVTAQGQEDDYSGLSIKLTCSKSEIVAGENFEYQVVISNSASHRIRSAPPSFMVYLDLVIQENGRIVPYEIKYRRSGFGPDLEIEANSSWETDGDLYLGYPLGIGEGNFTLLATYSPSREDRSFKIRSNTIQLTVRRRTPEQEDQYNHYLNVLKRPGAKGVQQGVQFLATYTNSLFEPKVRLMIAGRAIPQGEYDLAQKTLEIIPLLSSATKQQIASKHYVAARALVEQGYFYEAVVECESSPIPITSSQLRLWKAELQYNQLAAQVRLEPEALKVSPGVLTAHVRLPEDYPVSGISTATCDYATAERMMLSDDETEMIMKFRRQDIEAALARIGKSIDTNFVLHGVWQGNGKTKSFWGTDSITKIVGAGEKEEKKDKGK